VSGPDDEQRDWNPVLLASLVGVLILIALVWHFSANRSPDQDKLTNPQIAQTDQSKASEVCSASDVYANIKQQLFERAAQVRGRDQDVFARLAAAAVLRMENPVMESEDTAARVINCSGSMSIELPPDMAVASGNGSLTTDVDYVVQLPGDAAGMTVQVRNTDAIIASLATVQQVEEPVAAEGNVVEGNVAASESANVQPGPPSASPGRPSFDCARAQTPGEIAVCGDSGLAALDLNMSTQYRRALAVASPDQTRLLQSSRNRFLAYRDHCPDRTCIANAYLGRMREIRDIMEGRATPSR
jgi:hypothetical protein